VPLQSYGFFAIHVGILIVCSICNHSVVAIFSASLSAELTVCQAKLAHLTRAGNLQTPERISSLPTLLPRSCALDSPVSILCTFSNNSCACVSVLPFSSAVIRDAEAFEMAQPDRK